MSHPPFSNQTTSKAAARSVIHELAAMEQKVLGYIRAQGAFGATSDEIEVGEHMSHQTVSARINGLRSKGFLVDSGRTRRTSSGRQAIVWVLAPEGTPRPAPVAKVKEQVIEVGEDLTIELETHRKALAAFAMIFRQAVREAEFQAHTGYTPQLKIDAVLMPGCVDATGTLNEEQLDAIRASFAII